MALGSQVIIQAEVAYTEYEPLQKLVCMKLAKLLVSCRQQASA